MKRGYPSLEPAQIIIIDKVEHIIFPAKMLVGPVQRGVGRKDSKVVLSQEPFADTFRICDGNGKFGRVDRQAHAHRLHYSAD